MATWKKWKIVEVLSHEEGQALLVVALVMVVVLTVGLALVSRSITNQRLTTEEDNSQRAFSAAEAGVEQALKSGASIGSSIDLDNRSAIRSVTVTAVDGTQILLKGDSVIDKDEGAQIWLAPYPSLSPAWTGTFMTVYWGSGSDVCSPSDASPSSGGNSMAAIEIIVMTGTKANPVTKRYPIDPCSVRQSANKFDAPDYIGNNPGIAGFYYRKTIPVSSGLIASVIPLYADTKVAVKPCDGSGNNCVALPSQGNQIDSTGTAGGTSDAGATIARKITVYQGYPSIPSELLHYILFSTHN